MSCERRSILFRTIRRSPCLIDPRRRSEWKVLKQYWNQREFIPFSERRGVVTSSRPAVSLRRGVRQSWFKWPAADQPQISQMSQTYKSSRQEQVQASGALTRIFPGHAQLSAG